MKKFLVTVFLFGLLFLVFDKLFLIVRIASPKFDYDKRLEQVLNGEINKDIIIIGSSRGQSDIASWLLKDSLNLDVFNLAYGGSNVVFQKFILNNLLENNKKPKIIIKTIDDDFEFKDKDHNGNSKGFRIDRLQPLVDYEVIRKELQILNNKNISINNLFVLDQIDKTNFNFQKKTINDTLSYYGAKPGHKHDFNKNWEYMSYNKYDIEEEILDEVEAFKNIQDICQEHNIKLILAVAPVYRKLNKEWLESLKSVVNKHTYLFIFNTEKECYKNELNYSDYSHLNLKGATHFTNDLIDFIKEIKIEIYNSN